MHAVGPRGGGAIPRYGDVPPNQTLYVNNLNEKLKVPELQCCLLELFSTYGEVIDIVAAGSTKKKGQAFIVYRDISCATNALRALQGFVFLDKPMRVMYAKTKSDVVALEDGTFKPRAKADTRKEEPKKTVTPAIRQKGGTPPPPPRGTPSAPKFMPHPGAAPVGGGGLVADDGQASNVLFVENLPPEVNEMMLTMLFRQYPGFQDVRLIAPRNVAFIEYSDALQAGIAKHGLQDFKVTPEMALKIQFAKQ